MRHDVYTPLQKWLNPAGHTLTMTVKEREHVSCGIGGANESRSYQSFSLLGADETNSVQITDILSEL